MNGGRLSDEEVLYLGMEQFRSALDATPPDWSTAGQALPRIGLRYPEECEALRVSLDRQDTTKCRILLEQIASAHRAETEEELG